MIPYTRDLERQLRRLGVKVSNIDDVSSVLIETRDKEIILENPQVIVMEFKGQKIYQIIASSEKTINLTQQSSDSVKITDEDIEFIVQQTGLNKEEAKQLLIRAGGDIAKALMLYEESRGKSK
ncbi:MAG: nascent polypeptide-associated complex protein [Sulfolobales archaeon]